MNVLPHVIAIGNICREFSSSENKKSVETRRLKTVMNDNLKKQNLKTEVEHLPNLHHLVKRICLNSRIIGISKDGMNLKLKIS